MNQTQAYVNIMKGTKMAALAEPLIFALLSFLIFDRQAPGVKVTWYGPDDLDGKEHLLVSGDLDMETFNAWKNELQEWGDRVLSSSVPDGFIVENPQIPLHIVPRIGEILQIKVHGDQNHLDGHASFALGHEPREVRKAKAFHRVYGAPFGDFLMGAHKFDLAYLRNFMGEARLDGPARPNGTQIKTDDATSPRVDVKGQGGEVIGFVSDINTNGTVRMYIDRDSAEGRAIRERLNPTVSVSFQPFAPAPVEFDAEKFLAGAPAPEAEKETEYTVNRVPQDTLVKLAVTILLPGDTLHYGSGAYRIEAITTERSERRIKLVGSTKLFTFNDLKQSMAGGSLERIKRGEYILWSPEDSFPRHNGIRFMLQPGDRLVHESGKEETIVSATPAWVDTGNGSGMSTHMLDLQCHSGIIRVVIRPHTGGKDNEILWRHPL